MRNIVIGNIISIISYSILTYSATMKNKKQMFLIQSLEAFISMIKNIFLGGTSGAISNGNAIIRNLCLTKYEILGNWIWLFTIIPISYTTFAILNGENIIRILPCIATITYAIVNGYCSNYNICRLTGVCTNIMWAIYSFILKDYVGTICLILSSIHICNTVYTNKSVNCLENT